MRSRDDAPTLLLDRDLLENYEGVDRNGSLINGSVVANYLVNLMLSKDTVVQEISELARTFDAKMYSVLLATGASIKIYGPIENMLNAMLLEPLLTFDLSTATVVYVLLECHQALKISFPEEKSS